MAGRAVLREQLRAALACVEILLGARAGRRQGQQQRQYA
jgi:hypothetical protein